MIVLTNEMFCRYIKLDKLSVLPVFFLPFHGYNCVKNFIAHESKTMLIKEYQIPLPLSVEEYRIAQLYMIQVCFYLCFYLISFYSFYIFDFISYVRTDPFDFFIMFLAYINDISLTDIFQLKYCYFIIFFLYKLLHLLLILMVILVLSYFVAFYQC